MLNKFYPGVWLKLTKLWVRRRYNYKYLESLFEGIGCSSRFDLDELTTPGVFMFKFNSLVIDLNELKNFLNKNGIEWSVFYGEQAFHVHVNHNLPKVALDYIFTCVKFFIDNHAQGGLSL